MGLGGCSIRTMASRLVVILLPLACLLHAGLGLGRGHVLLATAAALIAWMLWRRHRRARFAAYVFFSAMVVRGALMAVWPALAFAVGAILLMQTSPAFAAWPRLTPGRSRRGGDRMREA